MNEKYNKIRKNRNLSNEKLRQNYISLPSLKSVNKDEQKQQKIKYKKSDLKQQKNQTNKQKSLLNGQQNIDLRNKKQSSLKKYYSLEKLKSVSQIQKKLDKIYISPDRKYYKRASLHQIIDKGQYVKKPPKNMDSYTQDNSQIYKQLNKQIKEISEPQIWIMKKSKKNIEISPINQKINDIVNLKLEDKNKFKLTNGDNLLPIKKQLNKQLKNISQGKNQSLNNQQSPNKLNKITIIQTQKHIKQKLVGQQAIRKFYSRYKKIDKIKQIEAIKNQINPLTIILSILQSYDIPPKRMDIIKLKGNQAILDLKKIGLGNGVSIKAISDILGKLNNFQCINLSYNSINFDRVHIIIPQLKSMRKINLSHNKIGRQGIELIANELCSSKNQDQDQDDQPLLEQLNLQGNLLSDTSLHTLLVKLITFKNLKILNLSKNYLGNLFAVKLKQFLIYDQCLKQLYLYWNDITAKGSKAIFQALCVNKTLKVLDISWNQLGYESITAVCNFFKKNKTLVHLDVSYCGIIFQDTKIIAESIKQNHTIIGLHFHGNPGFIDNFGYIHAKNQGQVKFKYSIKDNIIRRIQGLQRKHSHWNKNQNKKVSNNQNCWICDGWQQKVIRHPKDKNNDKAYFIHLDFNDFQGLLMQQKNQFFEISLMCPFKKSYFFITKFTLKKQFKHQCIIPDRFEKNFQLEDLSQEIIIKKFFIENKIFDQLKLNKINFICSQLSFPQSIFDDQYTYQFNCYPRLKNRPNASLFANPKKKQRNRDNDKKIRDLPELQNYFQKNEDQEQIKSFYYKCAQFDINQSKIRKLLNDTNQVNRITLILRNNYNLLKNVFSYLSNNCVNYNSIYYISESRFQSFVDFQQYEDKKFTKSKIRLQLIAALSINDNFSKNQQVNNRLFNRPQFAEFLLRVAIQKYCKNRKKNESQQLLSVQKAFQKVIKGLQSFQDSISLPQKWRSQYMSQYQISLLIKSYQFFLQQIYQKYCGSLQKNLNTKSLKKMILNQFKNIFLDSGLRKTKQALKDAQIAFIQSKNLQIQDGKNQFGLQFDQFLQAMMRMAYVNNIKPIGSENHFIWQKIQIIQNSLKQKSSKEFNFQIPLFLKFQGLLKKIYTANRTFQNNKMNRLFEKGLFSEQIYMLLQILKYRVDQYHKKLNEQKTEKNTKEIKILTKIKFNSLNQLINQQQQLIISQTGTRINLTYLLKQLQVKYKRISDQLDKKHNQLEEVSEEQN